MSPRAVTISPPERIQLGDDLMLRWVTVGDAAAIARSVGESLEHLRRWMPWADEKSADTAFQRGRLREQLQQRKRGEEWQYGFFRDGDDTFLGSMGIMTRRGPGTLEIGYWLHVNEEHQGLVTSGACALTEIGLGLSGIHHMIIVCDEGNARSAAVPQRLGYTLDRVEPHAIEAPSETGRMQFWMTDRIPPAAVPDAR
jgi:RimJ/RimL family protein N-acetyltransferase